MLHIIYLMLPLSIYQDETISCYFAVAFQRARLSVGQGRPWLVFPLFYQAGPPVAWRYCDRFRATDEAFAAGAVLGSDRETPIPRRQRCTLIVAGDVGASAID